MSYNKDLYTSSTSVLDAAIIYDQTESKLQSEINAGVQTSLSGKINASTALYKSTITTEPSSKNVLMTYDPGWYRVGISADSSVFPARYGVLEIYYVGSYGMARFTKVNVSEPQSWRITWNRDNSTFYESNWYLEFISPPTIPTWSIEQQSVITAKTITSGSVNTVTTYNSRKFSDYDMLWFVMGDNATTFRASQFIPKSQYKSDTMLYLIALHGNNGATGLPNNSGMTVQYKSDTDCYVNLIGLSAFTSFQVIGLRIKSS